MTTPIKIDACGAGSFTSVEIPGGNTGNEFISGGYDSNNQLLLALTNGSYLELRYYDLLPPYGDPYIDWNYSSVFVNLFVEVTGNTTNPATTGTYYTTGLFSNTDYVIQFDGSAGTYISTFVSGGSGGLSNVEGITFGPDGNLYASSQATSSIKKYNGTTGAYMSDFVTTGSGGLLQPAGLLFDGSGNLCVADQFSGKIRKYNGTTGAFISNFVSDSAIGEFVDFAFDSSHNIYIGQYSENATIRKYNGSTGAFISTWSSGNPNLPYGISGITFDSSGKLYASRDNSNIVEYYNSSGVYQGVFATGGGLNQAGSLVFGPDTNLYVCSEQSGQVLQYNGSTGAFIEVFSYTNGFSPTGLVFNTDLYVSVTRPLSTTSGGTTNRNIFSSTTQYYENSTLSPPMYIWNNGNYAGNQENTVWYITSTTPDIIPQIGTSYWLTAPGYGITGPYTFELNGGTGTGIPVVTLTGTFGCATPTFYVDGDALIGTWVDGVGTIGSEIQQPGSPFYWFGGNLYQSISVDHGQTWTTYSSQVTNTWQFDNSLLFPTGWTSGFSKQTSVVVQRNLIVFGYHVNNALAMADGADGWYMIVIRNFIDINGGVSNHVDFNASNDTQNNPVIQPPKFITAFADSTCHGRCLLRDDGTIEFAALSGATPGTINFYRCTHWDYSNNSTWVNHSNLNLTAPASFSKPDGQVVSNFTEYVVSDFSFTYRVNTLVVVAFWGVYATSPVFETGDLFLFEYSGLQQPNGSYKFNELSPVIAHLYDNDQISLLGGIHLITRKDAVLELVQNEYLPALPNVAQVGLSRNINLSSLDNSGDWY